MYAYTSWSKCDFFQLKELEKAGPKLGVGKLH